MSDMNWKTIIEEIQCAGMSQSAIGEAIGKSQAWVCDVLNGRYADLKWSDGEALRNLHKKKVGKPAKVA
jgi:hypothetical protein